MKNLRKNSKREGRSLRGKRIRRTRKARKRGKIRVRKLNQKVRAQKRKNRKLNWNRCLLFRIQSYFYQINL